MAHIFTATYHRMTHVTGPGCVLVSLRFGVAPSSGPLITIRATPQTVSEPKMNIEAYVAEVLQGLHDANALHGTSIGVEEIEIVPSDHPTPGQVRHCAKTLTSEYVNSAARDQRAHGSTEKLQEFLDAFEDVFDRDWAYTKEMLDVRPETAEQKKACAEAGLESIPLIADDGTFIRPKVEDEIEDWGNRGRLLEAYRALRRNLP